MEGRVPSRPARPQTTSLLLRGTKHQRRTWQRRWPGWNPALHRPHRVVAMHWGIADGKRWAGVVEGRVPSRPARPQTTSLLLRGTLQQRCTLATPLAGMEPGPPQGSTEWTLTAGARHWHCSQRWLGGLEGRVPPRPARPQFTSLLPRATQQQRCTCGHRWAGWSPALH